MDFLRCATCETVKDDRLGLLQRGRRRTAHTDHVEVKATLAAVRADTLGTRLELTTPLPEKVPPERLDTKMVSPGWVWSKRTDGCGRRSSSKTSSGNRGNWAETKEARRYFRKFGGDLAPDWAQRDRLRKWRDAAQRRKRHSWRGWLKRQRARPSGEITCYAQRSTAEEGYTGLRAEPEGEEWSIATRLEAAAAAWGGLQSGGRSHEPRAGLEPPAITRDQIRVALQRRGTSKARGADGWGPAELVALPDRWLAALGRMMGEWNAAGRRPEVLRQMCSMIPETQAQTEAHLGPIGLLPHGVDGDTLVATPGLFFDDPRRQTCGRCNIGGADAGIDRYQVERGQAY